MLEAVGAKIDVSPAASRKMLDEIGFCFLFAPAYHPGMKHAALVRRQLAVRTVMNLLGPCINPARPPVQLLGVADPTMLRRIAQTLDAVGVKQALVVHGSGLDEVALHGETRAIRLDNGTMTEIEISPEDAGIERAPLKVVTGGDVSENATRLKLLLAGQGTQAENDIVILNTAALLMTAGRATDLAEGAGQAREMLLSGKAGGIARPLCRGEQWLKLWIVWASWARSSPTSAIEVAERLAGVDLAAARPTTRSLVAAMGQPGARFIFEYKRRSPSEGMLSDALEPAAVARAYTGVADGMSVLTDSRFFGGSLADLAAARTAFDGPILAKDFIVDPRQVAEARIAGADAVLVILSVLGDAEARAVMDEAARLGMDVLVEVHDEPEMRRAVALGAALIGINNRDLKTFRTDLSVTERLAGLAGDALVISESGIATRADIDRLAPHVDGFLIGSTPMRSGDPHGEARALAFGRVKLCGLRTAADLDAAAPAAFAGLVFVPGTPRDLTLDAALNAIDGARNAPPLVAVFRDQVSDIISELPLEGNPAPPPRI